MTMGFVSLVGAGPGNPDLLTLGAARALGEADVVFYDDLVQPGVLAYAERARCLRTGKRKGRVSIPQEVIQQQMIDAARAGLRVVRLKGGDPFVFGRGGEEALALAAAGIPFEVVPGLSSAVAAPGLAGIPVTHRGIASGFVVLTGHAPSAYEPICRSLTPNSVTLVVLMGLGQRADLARFLLRSGWRRDTPAAILSEAGTDRSSVWTGALEELPTTRGWRSPSTIVIGDVVSVRAHQRPAPSTTSDKGVWDGSEPDLERTLEGPRSR